MDKQVFHPKIRSRTLKAVDLQVLRWVEAGSGAFEPGRRTYFLVGFYTFCSCFLCIVVRYLAAVSPSRMW